MKIKLSVLLMSFLIQSPQIFAISEGDLLPQLEIKAKDLKSNLDWKGKVAVINFWATWCEACKVELKEMNQEFKSLHDRADAVVGYVSLDKEPEKAKQYLEEAFGKDSALSAKLAHDASFTAADRLGVDSFPMTLVIDKSGKVVKIQRGFKEGEGSTAAIRKAAESL